MLERHDDCWRGEGPWAGAIGKETANDSSRPASLKAGQVDVVNYVSSIDYLALQREKPRTRSARSRTRTIRT